MIQGYLTALLSMIVICGLWLWVQRLWGRHFPEQTGSDGDVLAGRSGCRGCSCGGGSCRNNSTDTTISEAD